MDDNHSTLFNKSDINLAVLVVSCDKYNDVWGHFFHLFRRFWPDCPFNVYLLSNQVSANFPNVVNLLVGEDKSWSDSLREATLRLKEEYLLIFLDDLLLIDFVDTDRLLKVVKRTVKLNANCVKISPCQAFNVARHLPDKPFDELLGIVSEETPYRASAVLTIWKRDVLLELLRDDESAWDFEIFGSERSDKFDGFYATLDAYFTVAESINKGKWQRSVVEKLSALGVEIDFSKRRLMTKFETVRLNFQIIRAAVFKYLFPPKFRRGIKKTLLRNKYNYKSST